ncbi:MAG TPA: alanine--glyoxylate aminotransferase family protein [Candidatus Binatia bacterium]|nr:alanine--glyoxylate aminotransferase family protein [Candidatus Binatia bacterium]
MAEGDSPLLMIPGPTPVPAAIRAALAEPVRSHTGPENAASMRRIQAVLGELVGSSRARVHVFSGSGTLSMEAAVVNHAAPGDRVVVVSHGYFGDRFTEIADTLGMKVTTLRSEWGRQVDPEALRSAIAAGRPPSLVTFTHVDTSTGVLADIAALAGVAREAAPEAVLVVDGVCATGGVVEAMDAWDVDVVFTGAQKALMTPPGLTILAVSPRAMARRAALGRISAYYADLQRWDPVVDEPTRYFSTHATSHLRALEVSVEAIAGEGLERRYARHRRVADALREGMLGLGFGLMTDPDRLAPTLSVLALPPGVDDQRLRAGMLERGVVVAGCLGPWAGRGIRVGHMGAVGDAEVARTLEAAAGAVGR